MEISNVGDLRKFIAELPDNTPVEVYSGSVDAFVASDISVISEKQHLRVYGLQVPTVVIFTEN